MDESGKFCEHGISLEFGCPTCRVADYPRLKDQLASLEQQVREKDELLQILREDTFHHHPDDVTQIEALEQQVRGLTEQFSARVDASNEHDLKLKERIRALETALGSLLPYANYAIKVYEHEPDCDYYDKKMCSCGKDENGLATQRLVTEIEKLLTPVEESGKEPAK